jgi:hypothetical protein
MTALSKPSKAADGLAPDDRDATIAALREQLAGMVRTNGEIGSNATATREELARVREDLARVISERDLFRRQAILFRQQAIELRDALARWLAEAKLQRISEILGGA